MATTFVKIQTVTVGVGGTTDIQFSSIPQNYNDLKIVLSLRGSNASTRDGVPITFNGVSSAYSRKRVLGYDSSNIASDQASSQALFEGVTTANNATASVFGSLIIYIPNYTSANFKSFSTEETGENNSSSDWILVFQAGLWSNTAAITQINITPYATRSFLQYSTATLYGIKSS